MKFKYGIFCGLLVVICSISGMVDNSIGYIFTLALGIIQLVVSINYQTVYKKILVLCFLLEGIYYAVATIALLTYDIILAEKILGTIVGVGMLLLIMVSLKACTR